MPRPTKGQVTVKMASGKVVETPLANNSPSQNSSQPDDHFQSGCYSWVQTIVLFKKAEAKPLLGKKGLGITKQAKRATTSN